MSVNKPKEVRRTEILEAAMWCFASKGYNGTTIDDITKKAGLTKGGLYHHFGSKWLIFKALIDTYVQMNQKIWQQVEPLPLDKNSLYSFGLVFLENLIAHELLLRIKNEIESEAFRREEIQEEYRAIFEDLCQKLQAFIERLKNEKGIIVTDDSKSLAILIETTIVGIGRRYFLTGKTMDYKQVWRTFCNAFVQE